MGRAHIFEDADPPEYWAILHESLLRFPIATAGTMAEQLEHIVAAAQQSRMIVQILPLNAGAHPFMVGTATFLTFSDAPPVM